MLARIRRDQSGNTLAMAAIAMIPLSAMIGSGMDMSRTYLVKARLQSACDAGALAARKTMDGASSLSGAPTTQGNNFFNNNFPAGTYGVTSTSFAMQLDSEKQVIGTASTTVPMSLMKMFGYDTMAVTVGCSARLDITNTDVMFVLDVTGSMACDPNGSDCDSDSNSKIAGLRQAVTDFYTTLSGAAPATAQIRYGFVPYSQDVNIAGLLQPSQLVNNWTYQSRVASFNTPSYVVSNVGAGAVTVETYGSLLTTTECDKYGINKSYPTLDGANWSTGTPPANTTSIVYSKKDWGATGTTTGTSRTCRRNRTDTITTYATKYRFTGWTYQPVSYDVSGFKGGSARTIATGNPPTSASNTFLVDAPQNVDIDDLPYLAGTTGSAYNSGNNTYYTTAASTYNGGTTNYSFDNCIEERDTVANSTFTYGSIPSNAYDLDIDTLPSNTATTWRPAFPGVVYTNTGGRPGYACPAAARKLQTMDLTGVTNYVNGLVATGSTWHDIGMAWGARLISPTGLYASENATAPNGQPISRNIVFMTDGDMNADENVYGTWGYEILDQRTSAGNFGQMDSRHNSRFVALCNAARAKNVRIWVIGFGNALNTQLTQCADPGQAFYASDTAALRAQFTAIATKIAKLRLSQ